MLTLVALTALITGVSLTFGGLHWAGRLSRLGRNRDCASCNIPMAPLTEPGAVRSYEVLVCSQCTNAVTAVHGAPSPLSYCPACRQRSLQTPVLRLPDVDHQPRVEVHECCTLCGYRAVALVPAYLEEAPPSGKVIQFPGPKS